MIKSIILVSMCAAATLAGIVHDDEGAETHHHHEIDHKHATSHQSFKLHHFHAVPVYVKKEDQQFLKHPVEVGGVKHKLKILHPETEHPKSYGLTLENHGEVHDHAIHHHHHPHDSGHAGSEHNFAPSQEYVPQYHDIEVKEEEES